MLESSCWRQTLPIFDSRERQALPDHLAVIFGMRFSLIL
jgi:hypothetical protein